MNHAQFQNMAVMSPLGIVCTDAVGRITLWNEAATQMFGHSATFAIGRDIGLIVPDQVRETMRGDMGRISRGNSPELVGRLTEVFALRKDGSLFPVELSISMWREGGQVSFGAILRDVTKRREQEQRLYQLAHCDQLTGLANRSFFNQCIANEISAGHSTSLVTLDLDGFKDINDTLGHAVGDELLTQVARRLLSCVRATDTVSRYGGDEFTMLLAGIEDPMRAVAVADAAISALTRPFAIRGHDVHISASAGIAIHPVHSRTPEELLSDADLALYQAKSLGRAKRILFTPALRHAASLRRAWDDEIHRAVEEGEFRLFYQPQVRLADGVLLGAEALLRWQHPDHGLIKPPAFLPALERGLLAATVGDWVLETACGVAARWQSWGELGFRMGINLFSAQFRADNLVSRVQTALERAGLLPSALELEITENIILVQDETILETLRQLREMGVGIAFDDYGTGFASLSLLKRFPISRLKIDKSFVRGMTESPEDAAIISAILYLGESFGVDIIAEGIETQAQSQQLQLAGCTHGQGYLFGRAVSAEEFEERFVPNGISRVRSQLRSG
jgi:diguanylate cyclase (GGDEF)-like protein/PAS domain S-box-containing protein